MIIWLYYGQNEIRDNSRPRSRAGFKTPQGTRRGGGERWAGTTPPLCAGESEQEPNQTASGAQPSSLSLADGRNQGVLRHHWKPCRSVGHCSKIENDILARRDGGMRYEEGRVVHRERGPVAIA